jgi:hypothetical protein
MICWICAAQYVEGESCPRCGPPAAWGPTPEEEREQRDARPKCRHGVPYKDYCEACELSMLRDAVDEMVDADEYRRRWREP